MSDNPYEPPSVDSNESLIRDRPKTESVDLEMANRRFNQFRRRVVFTALVQILLIPLMLVSENIEIQLLMFTASIAYWSWAFRVIVRRLESINQRDVVIASSGAIFFSLALALGWALGAEI
jgi:hypothetical protein